MVERNPWLSVLSHAVMWLGVAIVADSFHTKPLMRIVQSADRYQILALSRDSARLFEGNRDRVDEIDLEAMEEAA